MDANATVYISDSNVSIETKAALRLAVEPLEAVPENQKDWHPGPDDKVLDIVHPSLFPLMYGKSKYLEEACVTLQGCSEDIAMGETVPAAENLGDYSDYSAQHQWLPSEVTIDVNRQAKITSYINNLRPEGNQAIYTAIEQVITKAIPMWKLTVKSTLYDYNHPRIIVESNGYDYDEDKSIEDKKKRAIARRKQHSGQTQSDHDEEEEISDSELSEYDQDEHKRKWIIIPEPGTFARRTRKMLDEQATTFEKTFSGNNLQVVVKLANIHLTPEKPTYDGGSWHIEVSNAPRVSYS